MSGMLENLLENRPTETVAHVPPPPVPPPSGRVDPRSLGCRCDVCPLGAHLRALGDWNPVPPEEHPGSVVVIAEAPGEREVTEGRPLVGRSGQEVMRALNAVNVYRPQASYSNSICCRPPNNDWKLFHHRYVDKPNSRITKENVRIHRENKERKKADANAVLLPLKPLIPQPIDCCKPQLLRQLEKTPDVLVAGVTAYYAITGKRKSIRKIRGSFNDYWLVANAAGQRMVMQATEGWKEGQPVQIQGLTLIRHLRILPTLHPAFVLRTPAWRPVFQRDVARFYRWLRGQLEWRDPQILVAPSADYLEQYLWDPNIVFHASDIETDGLRTADLGWTQEAMEEGLQRVNATSKERLKVELPRRAKIRCIQVGSPDGRAVVIPLRSVDNVGEMDRWYSPDEGRRVLQTLKRWYEDPKRTKVGHNHLYFDNAMIGAELGWEIQNLIDTMLCFRGAASELRRDLYTLGTMYTDVPDWKTGGDDRNASLKPRSDWDLHKYGAIDVHVTAAVVEPLLREVTARGQMPAMLLDHKRSRVAREIKVLGIGRVNEPKRAKLEAELVAKVSNYRQILKEMTHPKWNPRSNVDLTTLFVDDWGLQPITLTPTGEPSWDDATLRAYRQAKVLTESQSLLMDTLRSFRTDDKQLGTYVRPWRRWNDYRRTSSGRLVGGVVGPDGRLHPDYNVAAPKTGRISTSGPSVQNVIEYIRALVEPEEGHIYVGADYDQIELRLIAALAGIAGYLKVFKPTAELPNGGDPHAVTSVLIYGKMFEDALELVLGPRLWEIYKRTGTPAKPEDARENALKSDTTDPEGSYRKTLAYLRAEGQSFSSEEEARKVVAKYHRAAKVYKQLRVFAKTFVYAVIYGGTATTVFESVSAAEDPKTGKLLFPDMTLKEVRTLYNSYMSNAPELKKWWEETWEFARRNGYITEPIYGRRRDFPEFERNEILNLPIQGAAAIIMGLGITELRERIPPGKFGPKTGIVTEVHDFGMVEVPEELGDWACGQIEDSFTMSFPQIGDGLKFSSGAKKARNWMEA